MIGIAVIGYGYWGPNLARSFSEVDGCRVVAVVDASPAALAARRQAPSGGAPTDRVARGACRSRPSTPWCRHTGGEPP